MAGLIELVSFGCAEVDGWHYQVGRNIENCSSQVANLLANWLIQLQCWYQEYGGFDGAVLYGES